MWPFAREKRDKPGKRRARGRLDRLGFRARDGAAEPSEAERAFAVGAPGWPVVDGPHYLDVIGAIQQRLRPDWYLEIGAFKGHSLARSTGDYVAIDPEFQLAAPPPAARRAHLLQMTSAEAFASGFLERNDIRPDLAFLDGLHLFEAVLDDFIAAEARMKPEGVILLHDCLPSSDEMEGREWPEAARFWTGDVWKLPLALRELRSDLRVTLLDAWPTGLAVVERLDPASDALGAQRDALVDKWRDTRLSAHGVDAYLSGFEIASAWRFLQNWRR